MILDRPIATIDLARVRDNVRQIARECGVRVIAVVKADAYGLGCERVVAAIADDVAGFYCFGLKEAALAGATRKPVIALLPIDEELSRVGGWSSIRPVVWSVEQARSLRKLHPVLCVDTGMQRFACPRDQIAAVIEAGGCDEAFTHATKVEHARMLKEWCPGLRLHAAASSLLDVPEARLDAVRPGLALFRNAVQITTRLLEARDARGPAGYGAFISQTGRVGVIAGGYTAGVKPASCAINGQIRRIVECGMQTSFVEIGPKDRAGDEVNLLGDQISVERVASESNSTPHEALWRLTAHAERIYSTA